MLGAVGAHQDLCHALQSQSNLIGISHFKLYFCFVSRKQVQDHLEVMDYKSEERQNLLSRLLDAVKQCPDQVGLIMLLLL